MRDGLLVKKQQLLYLCV